SLGTANEVILVLENMCLRPLHVVVRDEPPFEARKPKSQETNTQSLEPRTNNKTPRTKSQLPRRKNQHPPLWFLGFGSWNFRCRAAAWHGPSQLSNRSNRAWQLSIRRHLRALPRADGIGLDRSESPSGGIRPGLSEPLGG